MSSTVTPPDTKLPDADSEAPVAGARLHWRALEGLYASAPINHLFRSALTITGEGFARIAFDVDPGVYHAAGAAHGTVYFKMLDDAAFYAANTLVTDRFLLTTSFNMHFARPIRSGRVYAEGRWVSGRRRVLVAEARLIDGDDEEVGRGTGTFMRSRIALSGLDGYARRSRHSAETMSSRLPAALEVSALVRQVGAAGGFAVVLARGEPESGAILVVIMDKGLNSCVYERMPQADGVRAWHLSRRENQGAPHDLTDYLDRRRAQDSDLWIIELDIPQGERFIGLSPPSD